MWRHVTACGPTEQFHALTRVGQLVMSWRLHKLNGTPLPMARTNAAIDRHHKKLLYPLLLSVTSWHCGNIWGQYVAAWSEQYVEYTGMLCVTSVLYNAVWRMCHLFTHHLMPRSLPVSTVPFLESTGSESVRQTCSLTKLSPWILSEIAPMEGVQVFIVWRLWTPMNMAHPCCADVSSSGQTILSIGRTQCTYTWRCVHFFGPIIPELQQYSDATSYVSFGARPMSVLSNTPHRGLQTDSSKLNDARRKALRIWWTKWWSGNVVMYRKVLWRPHCSIESRSCPSWVAKTWKQQRTNFRWCRNWSEFWHDGTAPRVPTIVRFFRRVPGIIQFFYIHIVRIGPNLMEYSADKRPSARG